jgi:hypothetical protein
MTLKTSKCGEVMHHARNGLQSIQGIMTASNMSDREKEDMHAQIWRIAAAIRKCDADKKGCNVCVHGVIVR